MPQLFVEELSAELIQEAAYVTDTTCPVCYAEFLDSEDLLIHVNQVHAPVINSKPCQLCPATCMGVIEYAKHIRDMHFLDLRACKYCAKVFLNGGKLKLHEARHVSDDNLVSCSQCNTLFPNKNSLELHENKYHDNAKDGVVLKCMPHLSELLCLKAKLLLQNVGKKTLKCFICHFSSTNVREYVKHLNSKKCEPFVCNLCSTVFKTRKVLLNHIQLAQRCFDINNSDEKTRTCPDCKKSIHLEAVGTHFKTCKALKCIDCDFVCKSVNQLSEHQAVKHPLDMNFTRCKFCSREFIGEQPMKKHVRRVHKPSFHLYKYQCRDCKCIFQHPQKLFAHFFSHHKDLMPFNCNICNKSFRVRKAFSLHIKLDHKSVGFVEFNDKYHVFFTANKSDNPFVPKCVIPPEEQTAYDSASDDNDRTGEVPTDTDLTNVETEDDKPKPKPKPKQIKKTKKTKNNQSVLIYSSDEEPLQEVRKRALKSRRLGRKYKKGKAQFICETCDKNCYTYQNYLNHMNTHKKNQELECVKCSQKFNSKNSLTKHMQDDHASSKLTETLKNLLKKKQTAPNEPETIKEPFKVILRKVKSIPTDVAATIKPVETSLSVKNFIENFTPDINDPAPKETIPITSSISIKPFLSPFHREPLIKLTKFKDVPVYEPVPLKMPQRFKQQDQLVKAKIRIRMVETVQEVLPDLDHTYTESYPDDSYYDRNDIPDVAQEVSLDGTEEPPKYLVAGPPTKIVIPKMPKGYSNIHVATLQAEAPYFKIIKVDSDNMTEIKHERKHATAASSEIISLPDGKKLVSANPLAHLLGDSLPEAPARYKPAARDFQGMLAHALRKLEEPPPPKRRKTKNTADKGRKDSGVEK